MELSLPKTLSDQISEYIVDKIVRMELEPGERILEQRIADELGVSRAPVREALRNVARTGLVEMVPRCGAHVRRITQKSIEGFCDVFILLFGHVVRR